MLTFHIVHRQDRARHFAERHRQSRLRRYALPQAGLSRRHALDHDRDHRLKENSNRKNGTVYVRSTGRNQRGEPVLSFCALGDGEQARRDAPAPEPHVPELIAEVEPPRLGACTAEPEARRLRLRARRIGQALGRLRGRRPASTMSTARPSRRPSISSPRGCSRTRRGCISTSTSRRKGDSSVASSMAATSISIARALSFNGLANAFHLAAINGGRHVAPSLRRRHHLCLERGHRQSQSFPAAPTWARCALRCSR